MSKLTKKPKKTKRRISKELIQKAFESYLSGTLPSLRKLSKYYGYSRCTYSIHFRKYFGENYRYLPKSKGAIHILKEYIEGNYSDKLSQAAESFYIKNKELLTQLDLSKPLDKLYTKKELATKTFRECCHKKHDYRHMFEHYYIPKSEEEEEYIIESLLRPEEVEPYIDVYLNPSYL